MRISIFKRFGLGVALVLLALAAGNTGQLGLAQAGKTITVCASGCDFAAIQSAVDAASAGDTVDVQAGTYQENVTIQERQDLILKGAGSDQVTLDGSAGVADEKPGIFIEKSQNITVQGFKIVGSRRGVHAVDTTGLVLMGSQFENNVRSGILLNNSKAELSDLVVTKTKVDQDGTHGEGVNFNGSQVVMKGSTLSENAWLGVILQGENNPTLTMDNCTISNNRFAGVSLYSSAQATISNSSITGTKKDAQGNGGVGVYLSGDSKAIIRQNTIADNNHAGIVVSDNSNATIDGNTIARNVEEGIFVGDTAHAQITNNQITASKVNTQQNCCGFGINLRQNAQATIQKNTISNNSGRGIMLNESSNGTIEDNTISSNVVAGIGLFKTAQATITNNRITNNKPDTQGNFGRGIHLESSSRATISGNTITDNAERGMRLFESTRATITNNTISNNGTNGISLGSTDIASEAIQAEFSANKIQSNKDCGIWSDSDTSIKITGQGNTISSNTKGQLCGTTSKFPKGFGGGK